ncbi:MAG: hypothetical protein PHO83_17000 [Geobacteraceae bacterium]|nr:hypothetical protein [Geobacteraceae bacterium]
MKPIIQYLEELTDSTEDVEIPERFIRRFERILAAKKGKGKYTRKGNEIRLPSGAVIKGVRNGIHNRQQSAGNTDRGSGLAEPYKRPGGQT